MLDLQRFCATDLDERKHLRQPWAHKGWMYATNGHVLVRIPAPEQSEAVFDHKVAASAEGMLAAFPATEHVPLPAFEAGEKCDHCKGSGYCYTNKCDECEEGEFIHGTHTYFCEECAGSGRVEATAATGEKTTCERCHGRGHGYKRVAVGADGAGFDGTYLAWIRELPNPLIATRGENDSAHFTFDGGEGLLMPMRGV